MDLESASKLVLTEFFVSFFFFNNTIYYFLPSTQVDVPRARGLSITFFSD